MPKDNLSPSQPYIPRRRFIKTTGACGLAGALGIPGFNITTSRKAGAQSQPFPERPNILLVITDQQRYPRHWPEGWAAQNLPNWHSLTQTGITFRRAYCNSSMCSPSRATLMTGLHPAHHGVTDTLTESTGVRIQPPSLGYAEYRASSRQRRLQRPVPGQVASELRRRSIRSFTRGFTGIRFQRMESARCRAGWRARKLRQPSRHSFYERSHTVSQYPVPTIGGRQSLRTRRPH